MIGWIIGWLVAVGIAIANAPKLKEIGITRIKGVALLLALMVLWPLALGWAIGKGINVKVNLQDAAGGKCNCPTGRTKPREYRAEKEIPSVPATGGTTSEVEA